MKTITRSEYFMLVGLSTLAHYHHRGLNDIELAACSITGDKPNDNQHTSDFIFNETPISPAGVDQLLDKLGVKVADE
jgi:hypothetical protein